LELICSSSRGVQVTLNLAVVFVEPDSQYFGSCAVTGAVDFIFGETAATYFKGSDIFPIGAGCITAGRPKVNVTDGMGICKFRRAGRVPSPNLLSC
jgi:hypothetical protein